MATPKYKWKRYNKNKAKEYFPNIKPKPNQYLHYFWWNAKNEVDLTALTQKFVNATLQNQLSNLNQIIAAEKQKLTFGLDNNSESYREIMNLYDVTTYRKNDSVLKDVFEPDLSQIRDKTGQKIEHLANPSDIRASMKAFQELKLEDTATDISKFLQELKDIAGTFFPKGANDPNLIAISRKALYEVLAKSANMKDGINIGSGIESSPSAVANYVLSNFLTKENEQIFEGINLEQEKIAGVELDKGFTKIFTMIAALQDFQDSGGTDLGFTSQTDFVVNSSSGKAKPITKPDDSKILKAASVKMEHMCIHLLGKVGEASALYAALQSHIELGDNFSIIEKEEKNTRITGSDSMQIYKTVNAQNAISRITEEVKKYTLANINKAVAKADIVIRGTNKGFSADVGFSIKEGKIEQPNPNTLEGAKVNINLQSGTPLGTILAREVNLSDQTYWSLLQILTAQGEGSESLESVWNAIKPRLVQLAFIDALRGTALTRQALYMVIDGKIFYIPNIIDHYINKGSANINAYMYQEGGGEGSPGLQRQTYANKNIWQGESLADTARAIDRSNILWSNVSQILFDTKISINMNIQNLGRLM